MNFNSVEQILNQLEQQPGWEKFREYRQLLQCWQKSVSQNIAQHTRPIQITRQILWVATSSAARAQELSFQRYALLKKLNQQLPFPLKDIRFSVMGWEQETISDRQEEKPILFTTIPQNSSSLVPCPNCGCPTPPGEIERWNLCYLCTAQKWSQEYRPPSFPKSE